MSQIDWFGNKFKSSTISYNSLRKWKLKHPRHKGIQRVKYKIPYFSICKITMIWVISRETLILFAKKSKIVFLLAALNSNNSKYWSIYSEIKHPLTQKSKKKSTPVLKIISIELNSHSKKSFKNTLSKYSKESNNSEKLLLV